VRAGLPHLTESAQHEAAEEKYRVLRGLLTWDLSAQYSARLWEEKKALQEADRLITATEARREALLKAQAQAPADFDDFDRRIETLRRRANELLGGVKDASRAQEARLAELAVAELARRREQIVAYIAQARFAVAQIYDRALRTTEKTQ
jgi:hypothetical protein